MADFSTNMKSLDLKPKGIQTGIEHGTTNDEHNKLYWYNFDANCMCCLEIDYSANTIQLTKDTPRKSISEPYPQARQCYGNLIYHKQKLFKFGGDDDKITGGLAEGHEGSCEFFAYTLKKSGWHEIKLRGKDIPSGRFNHQMIKYKHYGIVFGGWQDENTDCDYLYDFWLVDLNKFVWTKLFDSCIMQKDCVQWSYMNSPPQLVNGDILVFMQHKSPSISVSFYWIDLSKDKYHHSDWNKMNILYRSYNMCNIISNQDCLIVFDFESMVNICSMKLVINENENENYSLHWNNNISSLNSKYLKMVNIVHVKNNYNYQNNPIYYASFWVNNGFVWISTHRTEDDFSGLGVIYCMDNIARRKTHFQLPRHDSSPEFKILNRIGTGASATVYNASMVFSKRVFISLLQKGLILQNNMQANDVVIIKQENHITPTHDDHQTKSTLLNEYSILTKIHSNKHTSGITCKFLQHFVKNNIHHLVFSKCGLSLQHLHLYNNNKFSLSQSLLILNQMLIILYRLHSIGIVHNDIKPENLLIDNPKNIRDNENLKLYLIDFGISRMFWDFENNRHVDKITETWDEKNDESMPFEGTFRFSSLDHHCNMIKNTSRKQDIESLLYMCIYLHTNHLPWMISSDNVKKQAQLYLQTQKIKQESSIESDICKNVPKEFAIALQYIRDLKFDQHPDYNYLYNLFEKNETNHGATDLYTKLTLNLQSLSFIGSRVRVGGKHRFKSRHYRHVDRNRIKKIQSPSRGESIDQINKKVIKKYNDGLFNKKESNVTRMNYLTHMSVHRLKTRFGFYIHSLTMYKGVPAKKPTKRGDDYGGMIVFNQLDDNSQRLNGNIYMLPGSTCKQINKQYQMENNDLKLNGKVHGAIYYHYFKQNIQKQENRHTVAKFIRGFAVYGGNDENTFQIQVKSGAFNWVGLNFKDKKYRKLSPSEEEFISFCLYQYWNEGKKIVNKQKVFYFDQFLKTQHQRKMDDINKSKATKPAIIPKSRMVPLYNDKTWSEMESKQFGLQFYKNVILPQECIFNMFSFLSLKDEISLLQCCPLANQLVKYYYFSKRKWITIVSHSDINTDDDQQMHYIDLVHKRVKTSQIDPFGINFSDSSIKRQNCFIVVNGINDHDNCIINMAKRVALITSIKASLKRYWLYKKQVIRDELSINLNDKQDLDQLQVHFRLTQIMVEQENYDHNYNDNNSGCLVIDNGDNDEIEWYVKASTRQDKWH